MWKPTIIDGLSVLEASWFYLQKVELFDGVIENGNVFSLIPNANSIIEIPPLPMDVFN